MKEFTFNLTSVAVGIAIAFTLGCCSSKSSNSNNASYVYEQVSPEFIADSAYQYIADQVAFGTRVPESEQHKLCGDYLVSKLQDFGAKVYQQNFQMKAFTGKMINGRNIIGSYNPDAKKRILLFAHYDTRPFADSDNDKSKQNQAILGANDGASGVGVLLEIARQIGQKQPEKGIDIIFFDIEDYGPPSFNTNNPDGEWWCLGSQYWSKTPHTPNYKADFGILLDMVGSPKATFYKEFYSNYYAPQVLENVWKTGRQLGFKDYFKGDKVGALVDDHLYVNQIRNIPSIDIIDLDKGNDYSFRHYWHTHKDNMDNIDKETLKAVGQTVLEVIYK